MCVSQSVSLNINFLDLVVDNWGGKSGPVLLPAHLSILVSIILIVIVTLNHDHPHGGGGESVLQLAGMKN